jgi:hypothetical protein
MTIASSRTWLIMSGQLMKRRATRHMAHATRTTPARWTRAKASWAGGPYGLAPNRASSPLPVTQACFGQLRAGASW